MIIKVKGVKSIVNYSAYLLNQSKHKSEQIIQLNSYKDNINNMEALIEEYQQQKKDKRGKRPKALSVMINFDKNSTIEETVEAQKRVLSEFYEFVNEVNNLGLMDADISGLVSTTPAVLHFGKNNTGHTHNLINRCFKSKTDNKIVNIDLSKKTYHRKLLSLAGHTISEDIENKKDTSIYSYKLQQLEEQLNTFKNINEDLDKFIALALKDIKKGHSKKALTKLQKIKKTMNKG